MSYTRANIEFLLAAEASPLLEAAGMDGTTVDGTNLSLNAPIGRAILELGGTVTSLVLVTDTDVASVSDISDLLDEAALFMLEAILGNLDDVDVKVSPREEKLSQLVRQVERKIKRLRDKRAMTATAGLITKYITERD